MESRDSPFHFTDEELRLREFSNFPKATNQKESMLGLKFKYNYLSSPYLIHYTMLFSTCNNCFINIVQSCPIITNNTCYKLFSKNQSMNIHTWKSPKYLFF